MIGLSYGSTNSYCAFCGTDWNSNWHGSTVCVQIGGSPTASYATNVGYASPVEDPEPEPKRDYPRIDQHRPQRRKGSIGQIRPLSLSRGVLPRARGNC